jgi:4-amino-4-deoxy-L-arabinose transferase-like glycosyltransferase
VKKVWRLFWISLPIKLLVGTFLPITSDESYYWVWSHHPQLNYFDHPAMVSWLFYAGHFLENFEAAVRVPGILLGHATLFVWIWILKDFLSLEEGKISDWLWLALLSPLFGLGALIITPDIPLLFFWSLSLLCFLRVLQSPSWKNGLVFGVALGLGLISKYMIVLMPLSLILASVTHLGWWRRLRFEHYVFIFAGFFLGAAPFFLWNLQNDWISLRFQWGHGLGAKHWKPSWTFEYVGLQLLLIFPPLVYLMVRGIKKAPSWLTATALTPLFFFFFTSFRGYAEANWPIAAYPAVYALVALEGGEFWQKSARWFWGGVTALLLFLIFTGYSPFSEPIKTREFYEFQSLYKVAAEKEPLFARSYQMASRLSFAAKKEVYKLRGMNRRDAYDFWVGSLPPAHFFLILEEHEEFPDNYSSQGYKVIDQKPIGGHFKILEVKRQ